MNQVDNNLVGIIVLARVNNFDGRKKILINVNQVGEIILLGLKKIQTKFDLVGAIVLVGTNNFDKRKKDFKH